MKTYPKIGYFDRNKYIDTISLLHKEKNKTKKEYYFKKIAKDIIISESLTDNIHEGPGISQIQGVPFDFIGQKKNDLYIVELKGSDHNLNFPAEVQLVRMEKLINEAKKKNIALTPLLLQINLLYCFYCIWSAEFLFNCFKWIDKKIGSSRPIEPIVEWIDEFLSIRHG